MMVVDMSYMSIGLSATQQQQQQQQQQQYSKRHSQMYMI